MITLTLGQLRPAIGRVLGVSSTSTRVRDVINESQERMISKGDWQGVHIRYRVCTTESCLVWPRQIEAIEAVGLCDTPGTVRNGWFEFLGAGYGLVDDDDWIGIQLLDYGTTVAFDWVRGTGKKIRVYAMSANDAGKKIVLRYFNDSAQKVYSSIGGAWQEGEELTLVAPPAYAVTSSDVMQQGLYGVVKPVTEQPVILYEYDGSSNTRTLAQYEPEETNPRYRMSFLPNLNSYPVCGDSTDDCSKRTVTVMARLAHVPVVNDNDPLVLSHQAAFKLMAMSIKEEEGRNMGMAQAYEGKAMLELEHQLRSYLGQGPVVTPRFEKPSVYGGGGIFNLVD